MSPFHIETLKGCVIAEVSHGSLAYINLMVGHLVLSNFEEDMVS